MLIKKQSKDSGYWMRPLSFIGLRKIIQVLIEHPSGLRARDLDLEIINRGLYMTVRGNQVSKTTLYHCRNTLIKLGIIIRVGQNLTLNIEDADVKTIISETNIDGISITVKNAFARLVFKNKDCYEHFFRMFLDNNSSFEYFRENGYSVTWQWNQDDGKMNVYFHRDSETIGTLITPSQVKSILYGLRYWAKNELGVIDEYFREDRQNIIYPLRDCISSFAREYILTNIMSKINDQEEWTTLSVHDLIADICEKGHLPVKELFSSITQISKDHSGYIVFIPTSERIASLTAGTRATEDMRLRSYYQDEQGRYISHIRIHKEIRKERL